MASNLVLVARLHSILSTETLGCVCLRGVLGTLFHRDIFFLHLVTNLLHAVREGGGRIVREGGGRIV